MYNNLFQTFMEAEGDLLQDFNPETMDDGSNAELTPSNDTQPPMDDLLSPPSPEDELSPEDNDAGGMEQNEGTTNDESKEDSISKKVSANLNAALLEKFTEKNEFIQKTIDNLRKLMPLLPTETIQKVNEHIKTLNSAFEKGKDYITTKFIDKEYGENLMYFEKLNILYELLLKNINQDIKVILK